MSLRTTDADNVAIYDAVTGAPIAIEVFSNAEQAEDFLAWHGMKGHPRMDLIPYSHLADLRKQWYDERVDPESGYIREDAEELGRQRQAEHRMAVERTGRARVAPFAAVGRYLTVDEVESAISAAAAVSGSRTCWR